MELSKKDIESLGFKEVLKGTDDKLVNSMKFIKNISLEKAYTLVFYYGSALENTFNGHNVYIRYSSEKRKATVFMGYVRNKEELKVLLKQLGICN